jgi:thioredoxin-related protein
MVSSEPIRVIKEFSIEYELNNQHAITFAKISIESINSTFGTISVPHTFIYNKNGNLIKEIRGESKVEAILNSFNEN